MPSRFQTGLRPALVILATGLGLAAATGIAFAMWVDKGGAMFMSMVETGLAWCF